MAAMGQQVLAVICFSCSFYLISSTEISIQSHGKPCAYFGDARVSAPQGNLINCSWYASNACCKRTEVTSVFGSMYPLYGANKLCAHQINYLMCYFCSPEQYRWYDRTVHVCADFCRNLYNDCKDAEYDGLAIGEAYATGEDFCRGQKFEVVESKTQCFDFDPLVFGAVGRPVLDQWILVVASLITVTIIGR